MPNRPDDCIYFTPGPSQLYPGVPELLAAAVASGMGSISHRSSTYQAIHQRTVDNLRNLLGIPEDFHIFFLGSATEAWERIFLNTVQENSFHFVNGAFSDKCYQFGLRLQKTAKKAEVPPGQGFDLSSVAIPATELIAITQNETSTGVQFPIEDIKRLRTQHPEALIAVDVVSSLPYVNLDYAAIDTAYFSVQKCFGLPAGLGVWLVNERMVKAATAQKNALGTCGAHHTIAALLKQSQQHQTPATPNVLLIDLLGKVTEKMLQTGIQALRSATTEKAGMLYQALADIPYLDIAVKTPHHRSQTVVVAHTEASAKKYIATLKNQGYLVGSGYGTTKDQQLRIANFPAHSVAEVEQLIKVLKKMGEPTFAALQS